MSPRTEDSDESKDLEELGQRYARALERLTESDRERLEIASEIIERGERAEGAELHEIERDLSDLSAKPHMRTYKLGDPRAALTMYARFCNIRIPVPNQAICLALGCPAFNPPGAPAGKFCFLIGCFINVCPPANGGGAKILCVYLCF